ncbi:MAG TPA: type 1 glutamine amidotransferase [Caulobacteraceae bacterium]
MKIGVLETGAPPRALQPGFGRYPAMFERLLGAPGDQWLTYDVRGGGLPKVVDECAAWVVTGSAAGVYDQAPWMAPTMAFLRQAKGRAALIGVCFGHQLMAQAFGGEVVKSPKGWGIGLHRYQVASRCLWMDDAPSVAAPASHQDQVVRSPPGATVLAASEFTPLGMLAYDDPRAISIQLHPEFEPDFAAALIEARGPSRYGEGPAKDALASLTAPDDRRRLGRWLRAFLDTACVTP